MLVLSRKANEKIFVTLPDGQQVIVTVCYIGTESVRIGFDAPKTISIHRDNCRKGKRDDKKSE